MIIRTGLIKNRDGVGEEAFAGHWLNVHGPLARQVPGMTAYSQNHIVERYPPIETPELHRVDGLSQLYFPDVPTMAKAMEGPEQRACVEDIKGFLSEVTIVIQRRGEFVNLGEHSSRSLDAKLMAVLVGDPQAAGRVCLGTLGCTKRWQIRRSKISHQSRCRSKLHRRLQCASGPSSSRSDPRGVVHRRGKPPA